MSTSTRAESNTGDEHGRKQESMRNADRTLSQSPEEEDQQVNAPQIPSALRTYYQPILGELGDEANRPHLIALTSCKRGEGVSTVAVQLAICAAQQELSVLLIDCNENNPSLHLAFGVKSSFGFRDFLKTGVALDTIHATNVDGLSVMPYGRGRIPPLPRTDFEDALESVQSEFDLLVLDLPAVSDGRHTTRWAMSLENLLLVIGNSTSPAVAAKYKQRLEHAGANLCGIVRNLI